MRMALMPAAFMAAAHAEGAAGSIHVATYVEVAAASAKDLRVVTCGAARAAPSGVEIVRLHGRDCGPKEARVTVNVRGNTSTVSGQAAGSD